MIIYKRLLLITLVVVLTTTLYAKENKVDNAIKNEEINKTKESLLFTIDNIPYEKSDFSKEFIELSKKKQRKFISNFLYYELLFKSLTTEKQKYKIAIKDTFNQKKIENRRKGIVLTQLQKSIFDIEVSVNTIAYQESLAKHKDIDLEIEKFYTKNREGFKFPQRAEISLIVLKDSNKTKVLLKKIKENNDSIELFTKLAKEYSVDRKRRNKGGYLGEISQKIMGKKYFDTVWSTKERRVVSKVLEHKGYYHIVYVLKKHEAEQRTIKEERDGIEEYLLKKEIKEWRTERFKKAKKNAQVKFYNIKL